MKTVNFPALITAHSDLVHRIVAKYCGNGEDVRDLIATIWSKAYASCGRLEKEEDFSRWIAVISRNCCIDHLRRARRQVSLETVPEQELASPDTTLQGHLDRDRSAALQQGLAMLSSEDRLIIVAHHIRGESLEAISRQLGISAGAAKVKLFRAREKLRDALLRAGHITPRQSL